MFTPSDLDIAFYRAIRPSIGEEWHLAKPRIIARLPPEADPEMLDRYIDDSERPSVNLNKYGIEPRFYAHRDSKRVLEFYRTIHPRPSTMNRAD